MPQILQLIKRHETEPHIKRLIACCPSAHTVFRQGNQGLGFWKEEEAKNKGSH